MTGSKQPAIEDRIEIPSGRVIRPWATWRRGWLAALLCLVAGFPLGGEESTSAPLPSRREPWSMSRLTGSPSPPSPYLVERVFPSLTFDRAVEMAAVPGSDRLAVLELAGKIFTIPNQPLAASVERDLFADAATFDPQFHRLYGIAFHPRFAENRYCYISYVLKPGIADGSRVSRFRVLEVDPPRLDPASEQIVITWMAGGHNGAHLQFGPDGCLYVSTGDGGESFPPDGRNTGQDISDLLASILRIDVDHASAPHPYQIPADNPFVKEPGARGEVWAYGLRNPWKMCFDPADGSLWVADVGWEMWEMIYRIERGGNYGWSLVEGRQPVHRERQRGPTPIIPPTVEHDHTESRSITGGYFYHSPRLPDLNGAYVYGDYVTGKIWALRHAGEKITWRGELVDTPLQIVSFGLDHQGEVYVIDWSGTLHRLVENPRREVNVDFPRRLSETGLFTSAAEHRLAPGVLPYEVNAQPWADGTTAERFVGLPGLAQLNVYKKTDVQIGYIAGEWEFPSDGVLGKTVSIQLDPVDPGSRRRLETQILHFDVDTWKAYNYIWNDEQTDAVLADDVGSDRVLTLRDPASPGGSRSQTWHHASRLECLLCHTTRAGTVHGFRLPQLSRPIGAGNERIDQLAAFDRLGLFAEPLPVERSAWPDPYDAGAPVEARARAYLHVNCGHCHRRGGGGSAAFDVQFHLPLEKTNLIGNRPTQGTFGLFGAQLVAPGDPFRSVLYYRLAKLGHGRMPQFGSQVVDSDGLALIRGWIASLPSDEADPLVPAARKLSQEQARELAELERLPADHSRFNPTAQRLLASPRGALQLAASVERFGLGDPRATALTTLGTSHADPIIRDLFERFVPEESRVRRLGTVVDASALLALEGNVERGQALFHQAAGVQCRNCHRIGEQGRAVGPDLNQVGKKFTRAQLLEELLEPSKRIDPKFVTYLIETSDGLVISGLLVERNEREWVLRDVEGKERRIPVGDVEQAVSQQKSLMPELLLRDLTAEQVADLLAYLASLR